MKKFMWKPVSSKIVHQNPFFYVREDAVIQPSGGNGIYYVIEAGRSVMIVPLSRAGDLFLIKQHQISLTRFPLRSLQVRTKGAVTSRMQDANFVKKPDFCLKIGRSSATYK